MACSTAPLVSPCRPQCVDWSDASEARQAAELMQQWAPIGVADALELLSPDFVNEEASTLCLLLLLLLRGLLPQCLVPQCRLDTRCQVTAPGSNLSRSAWHCGPARLTMPMALSAEPSAPHRTLALPQVRGHAVEVLQKTDDEELLYYLLQLVQVRPEGHGAVLPARLRCAEWGCVTAARELDGACGVYSCEAPGWANCGWKSWSWIMWRRADCLGRNPVASP